MEKAFELSWPELEKQLTVIPSVPVIERHERSTREMVREILDIIRAEARAAEARDSEFYKSRDSFMSLMIKLFQAGFQNAPPEIAQELEDFNQHASYFLTKRDISRCSDCFGTGWMIVPGKGAHRCEHKGLDELEPDKEQINEDNNS